MKDYTYRVFGDSNGKLHFMGENKGFTAFEVLGLLQLKIDDITRQIRHEIPEENIVRIIHENRKNE